MVPLDLAGLIQPFYGGTLVFFLSFSFFLSRGESKENEELFFQRIVFIRIIVYFEEF